MAHDWKAYAAFGACTLIWGTTWLAIKEGYAGLDAVWSASLRFLAASAVLLVLFVVRRPAWRPQPRHAAVIGFVGLVLFGLDYGLIYWGEQFIPSGLTAILFATMPLFVGLFSAFLIPHEGWTLRHGLGVLLGIAGLVAIFNEHLRAQTGTFWPMAAIVVSAAAAGICSVVMRRWGRDVPSIVLNGGAMFVGALALLAASMALGETQSLPVGKAAWWSLLYLAVFGSVVSFLLYLWLLGRWTANRTSLITLLTPVVAVAAGVVYLGERLTLLQMAGAAAVLAGVGLSLWTRKVPDAVPQAAAAPEKEG